MSAASDMPVVAVFRSALLAISEGFIVRQAEAVPGFTPFYLGQRRMIGASIPAERTWVSSWRPAPLRKALFVIGYDPAFNRRLKGLRPTLVHAHFGPDAAMVLPTVNRLGVPLVVTFHGYDVMLPDRLHRSPGARLWVRRREAVFQRASLLIAVSDAVKARLLELGAPPEKVVVHHIGVDTTLFADRSAANPDDTERDPAHILFVGRLTEVKGVGDLLEAAALLRAQPSLSLTIVGDGELDGTLRARAAELGLKVDFTGALPHDDVAALMTRATLLCAPSKVTAGGQREAFGLVLAEAQAAGLPVVAYRSGGTSEALTDGVGGLLVEEGNVAGLAEALGALLGDPARRAAMGAAGSADALNRFDLTTQSRRLGGLYASVLAVNRGSTQQGCRGSV